MKTRLRIGLNAAPALLLGGSLIGGTVRREPEFFGDIELILVFMARRLPDALKLERILTDARVDYHVETGTYTGGFLMRRELAGAFFYVAPADADNARSVLIQNRYKPYQED